MRFRARWQALASAIIVFSSLSFAATSPRALNEADVLALLAGASLPESIAAQIKLRGLSFHPDENCWSRLNAIGTDARVLEAMKTAQVTLLSESSERNQQRELLEHLTKTAQLIARKQKPDAANELNTAMRSGSESPAIAFVMAELLRDQQNWGSAAAVFREILSRDPEFPEAHTKFSYELYRVGDYEEGTSEA